jgi:hypothetical protein
VIGRRQLLRDGGVVVSLGAIIAACGDDRGGSDDPGRVGNAPTASSLPEGVVDDVALLRTAQSIEFALLEVLDEATGNGALDAETTELIDRLVEDHNRHADHLGDLITAAGGETYECPNPFLVNDVVTSIQEALEASDDVARDLLYTAHAFVTLAAATYQDFVGRLSSPELRKEMMVNGADENRHSATLALAITGVPKGYYNPVITGGDPDEGDVPTPYAIPASFGQVAGVELVIGVPNEEGVRTRITLQTPAENSFVYDFMSC